MSLFNDLDAKKEGERQKKLVLLSPYAHMSLRELKEIGFVVGKDLLASAREFKEHPKLSKQKDSKSSAISVFETQLGLGFCFFVFAGSGRG